MTKMMAMMVYVGSCDWVGKEWVVPTYGFECCEAEDCDSWKGARETSVTKVVVESERVCVKMQMFDAGRARVGKVYCPAIFPQDDNGVGYEGLLASIMHSSSTNSICGSLYSSASGSTSMGSALAIWLK